MLVSITRVKVLFVFIVSKLLWVFFLYSTGAKHAVKCAISKLQYFCGYVSHRILNQSGILLVPIFGKVKYQAASSVYN